MDDTRFWDIIESGRMTPLDDQDRQLAAFVERLNGLPPEELVDFHRLFTEKIADAYTWDLWGAAHLINGGCSDDGFAYFRSWLISRGRTVYSGALREPDSLASIVDPDRDDYEFEDLWGIAQVVFEATTGEEMPVLDFDWPAEPRGTRWDFEDDDLASQKLPRLAALYV